MRNAHSSGLTFEGIEAGAIRPVTRFHAVGSIAILLLALLMANGALAATLRVATGGGADTGNCQDSPCQTLAYALGQATDGDTIEMGYQQNDSHTFA